MQSFIRARIRFQLTINATVCILQVLVQRVNLYFVSICDTVGTMDLLCFPRSRAN